MPPVTWLLNFSAEWELENGRGPGPQPGPGVAANLIARSGLVRPGDVDLSEPGRRVRGMPGLAWCPTLHARRRLERAGALLAPTPSPAIIRHVNDRRFLLRLQSRWARALQPRAVDSQAQLTQALKEAARPLLFKTPLGWAGRGQRRLLGAATPDDQRWLDSARAKHGLIVERWVQVELDLSLHGYLDRDFTLHLSQPLAQRVDDRRAWVSSWALPADALSQAQRQALSGAAHSVARALRDAQYFGPFGIDAYLWRDPARSGSGLKLNPLSELNARFTMAYPLDLQERARRQA